MNLKDLPVGTSFADGHFVKAPYGHFAGGKYYKNTFSSGLWDDNEVPDHLTPVKFYVPEEFFE